MSWGSTWRLVTIGKGGLGRKENGQLGRESGVSGVGSIGAKENPAGLNLRGLWWELSGSIARKGRQNQ